MHVNGVANGYHEDSVEVKRHRGPSQKNCEQGIKKNAWRLILYIVINSCDAAEVRVGYPSTSLRQAYGYPQSQSWGCLECESLLPRMTTVK